MITRAEINPLKGSMIECSICRQVEWYGLKDDGLALVCSGCSTKEKEGSLK